MSIRRRKGGRIAGWLGLAISVSGLCLAFTAVAGNAAGGAAQPLVKHDNNKGDVWVDTVGQISGPGHEQDPHLSCDDINLWGNGLADSTGTFTIDGIPPSDANGSKEVDYSGTWKYTVLKGNSMIALINVDTLVDAAIANGDAPKNKQGLHFKLDFGQDPQKHKTFWVDCPADPATTPTPTPTPEVVTPTPTPTPTATPTPTPTSTTNTSSTTSTSSTAGGTSPTTTISGGVQGLQTGPPPTPNTGAEVPLGLGSLMVLMGTGMFGLSAARRRNDR
jgi:hypothetical protein